MKEKYTVENLEKLLDSIPYGVALQDENYKFLFINKSFCNNINKKKEDIIGKNPKDVLDDTEWSELNKTIHNCAESKSGFFCEFHSSINNKWYDVYCTQINNENNNYTATIINQLNMNMTRVYNNFYYAREKDSMDFLGYSNIVYDNKRKNFVSSAEFKKRMTLLCEDLQHKVKADNINIYLIDDETKDINLFLSTGNPIELCDYCKKNIFHINDLAKNIDFNNIFKECPKSCNLFKNGHIPNKCQVKIYPIKYGSKLIGIMFVYYDEDKNLMEIYL